MAEINPNLMRDQATIESPSLQIQEQVQAPQVQAPQVQAPVFQRRTQTIVRQNDELIEQMHRERQNFSYVIFGLFFLLIILSGVSVYFVVQQSRHTHNVEHEVAIAAKKMDAVVRIYKEAKDETHLYTSAIKMMGQIQTAMINEQQSKMITSNALNNHDRDIHDL